MTRTLQPNFARSVSRSGLDVLRLSYVPLLHAAPLWAAHFLGFFKNHGLKVRLAPEVGWATIREKIVSGELDAAQALAPMPLAMALGDGSARCECLTALVLTTHGNCVVLSPKLWEAWNDSTPKLKPRRTSSALPTLGVVYHHSTHHFILRQWLAEADFLPDRDYRLVVVPPQQMVAHLKAGHIDGCCVGEPWGSLAVRSGVGIIAATSAELAPGHPEKVLLVRRSFSATRSAEHKALVHALLEACAWCSQPENRAELTSLLARREALNLPPDIIEPALSGNPDLGGGRTLRRPDLVVFHGPGLNDPSPSRAAWVGRHFDPVPSPQLLRRVYDSDLFHSFTQTPQSHAQILPEIP